ncbi:MAG: hypothetical protein ACTSYD_13600 [Candidatus Heimdallarchaeaceae archaeon]
MTAEQLSGDYQGLSSMPTSFSLGWLELEILKLLKRSDEPIYKGEIISLLRNAYADELGDKPESTFYAIFDKLQENAYVEFERISGKGYKTFARITEKGKTELKNSINWAVSTLLTEFTAEIVRKLLPICKKHMACHKELAFGLIGLNTPDMGITELCNNCIKGTSQHHQRYRINMILPELVNIPSPLYQNIQVKADNLLLRDNALNRILSILTLGSINEKQIMPFIKEIYRILAPKGVVGFYELKEFHSYFYEAMQNITEGFNLLRPIRPNSRFRQFNVEELKGMIASVFGQDAVEVVDLKEIVLILAKKPEK